MERAVSGRRVYGGEFMLRMRSLYCGEERRSRWDIRWDFTEP